MGVKQRFSYSLWTGESPVLYLGFVDSSDGLFHIKEIKMRVNFLWHAAHYTSMYYYR